MAHNFSTFDTIFFRTRLCYQHLANRETGDLRFYRMASLMSKNKKQKYTDFVGKMQKEEIDGYVCHR